MKETTTQEIVPGIFRRSFNPKAQQAFDTYTERMYQIETQRDSIYLPAAILSSLDEPRRLSDTDEAAITAGYTHFLVLPEMKKVTDPDVIRACGMRPSDATGIFEFTTYYFDRNGRVAEQKSFVEYSDFRYDGTRTLTKTGESVKVEKWHTEYLYSAPLIEMEEFAASPDFALADRTDIFQQVRLTRKTN